MDKKDVVITERVFKNFNIPPLITWGLVLVGLLIIHFVWVYAKNREPYFITALAGGLLIYLGLFSPSYVYDKILELIPTLTILVDLPENKVKNWVEQNFIERIFNKKYMLLSGLILPLFIVPGGLLGGWLTYYNQDPYIKIFDLMMGVFASFTSSMSLFMAIPILNGFSQLRKLPMKTISIFRLSEFATPISLTFAKLAFIVSIAYSLMLVIVISGAIIIGLPFYFYASVGVIVTIISFIIPQIELRNVIRKAKWQILEQISNEIEKSMKKLSKDSTPDNIKRVESLVELHRKMQNLNETSFTWETITRLFGSAILPVIVTLLEKLIRP